MNCRDCLDERAILLIAIVTLLFAAGGCSQRQSVDAAIDKALLNAGQQREKVYPLAGKVTIDFQSPRFEKRAYKLLVMLNDAEQPDVPVQERPFSVADSEGAFSFQTYVDGDGVKCGRYVLTFAVLRKKGNAGFVRPDQLNNLYNGPDQNSKNPSFVIDHQAPGKTDYAFNLEAAGKEKAVPEARALTEISWRR